MKTQNIEKKMPSKGDGSAKKELMKLAKDEADILFDLENEIVEQMKLDYLKQGKPGETFMDWLKSKPESYLRNLPLQMANGGKVVLLSDYLKQKEKPKIKKINLAQGDFEKTVSGLSSADKEVIKDLLRRSGIKVSD
ncbi:MAG TPA: hypothetical protein DHV30_14290 [Balneola sp.]|jgi:PleD family two-component response regulator|nr:hypothetical protein [Balneola sp.]|tara:strand:+ start:430 stop:840 length:411 start_codon:yes stop_codon:yes gene_type:complete